MDSSDSVAGSVRLDERRLAGRAFARLAMALLAVFSAAFAPAVGAQSTPTRGELGDARVVRGLVTDVAGKPIPDARVRLLATGGATAMAVRADLLRALPLPPIRCGADGRWFLPVTELHRAVLVPPVVELTLVIEAAGYHAWREPLRSGLRDYRGGTARLLEVQDEDWLTLECGAQRAGGIAVLETRLGRDVFERLELPLDEGGAVRLPVRPIPTPMWDASMEPTPLTWRVRALAPGACSGWAELEFDGEKFVHDELPEPSGEHSEQRLPDAPPPGARVLHAHDGGVFWRPHQSEVLRAHADLWPRYVVAEGFRAMRVGDADAAFEPLADAPRKRVVVVQGEDGTPVAGAEVVLRALEDPLTSVRLRRRSARALGWPPPRPLLRRTTDAAGRAQLTARSLREPTWLEVRVPGSTGVLRVLDPRPLRDTGASGAPLVVTVPKSKPLEALPQGAFAGRLRDDSAQVLGDAWLVAMDESAERLPAEWRSLRFGADGRLRNPERLRAHAGRRMHLVVAGHEVLEVRVPNAGEIEAGVDEAPAWPVPLRLRAVVVTTVDEQDESAPLAGVTFSILVGDGPKRERETLHTDGSGSAVVTVPVASALRIALDDNNLYGEQPVDDELDSVRLLSSPMRDLRVRIPRGAKPTRRTLIEGGSSSSRTATGGLVDSGAHHWVLRWPRDGARARKLWLGLGEDSTAGPPIRIEDELLAAAVQYAPDRLRAGSWLDLDQSRIFRCRRLVLRGAPESFDASLVAVRLRSPHYGGRLYNQQDGDFAAYSEADGLWLVDRVRVGDFLPGGTVRLVHPDLLPCEFPLPEAAPRQAPEDEVACELTVQPAARVRLLLPDGAGARGLSVQVHHVEPAKATDRYEQLGSGPEADSVALLPAGLAAGSYRVVVRGRGIDGQQSFEIEVGENLEPVEIDLRDHGKR